jgi:hypothetical protein
MFLWLVNDLECHVPEHGEIETYSVRKPEGLRGLLRIQMHDNNTAWRLQVVFPVFVLGECMRTMC